MHTFFCSGRTGRARFVLPLWLSVLWLPPVLAGETGREATIPSREPSLGTENRRQVKRVPHNIVGAVRGVFEKESVRPALIGLVATGLSRLLDDEVREEIADSDEDDDLADFADEYLGPLGLGVATVALFASGRASDDSLFRTTTYDLGVSAFTNLAFTGVLKKLVGRERPNQTGSDSFPSGHTSNAFALATVVSAHYGTKVGVPAYAAATAIGLSRLRDNSHWLSDVVAGAALGYVVGRTVVRRNGGPAWYESGKVQIMPNLDPSSPSILVGIRF